MATVRGRHTACGRCSQIMVADARIASWDQDLIAETWLWCLAEDMDVPVAGMKNPLCNLLSGLVHGMATRLLAQPERLHVEPFVR